MEVSINLVFFMWFYLWRNLIPLIVQGATKLGDVTASALGQAIVSLQNNDLEGDGIFFTSQKHDKEKQSQTRAAECSMRWDP